MSRLFPHWREWLSNAWYQLRWVFLLVGVIALYALFQQPRDEWLRLLPYLIGVLVVTFVVFLAINVSIDALWEGSPLWPKTSRFARRATALIYVPIIVMCLKGAVSQWDTDPARALGAGSLAAAFCWVSTMIALDRTWRGMRRE